MPSIMHVIQAITIKSYPHPKTLNLNKLVSSLTKRNAFLRFINK